MKLNARFIERLFNDKQQSKLTFLVSNYQQQRYINELTDDKEYSIEIKEVKQKRSVQQNKYLWAMIRALALKTREDDNDLYIKLLMETKAKFNYVWGLPEAEEWLKNNFRVVQKMGKRDIINDKGERVTGFQYRVYEGSSKFTVEEMNHLLDTLIRWCIEEGIETEQYKYE